MNAKEFMTRWIKGMRDLSQLQQLHAQMVGTIGMIFGFLFAWVSMFFYGMWYFSFIMIFAIFMNVINYIGVKQKYDSMIKLEEELTEPEEIPTESGII